MDGQCGQGGRGIVQVLCSQPDCCHVAEFRYEWPGLGLRFACRTHAEAVVRLATHVGRKVGMVRVNQIGDDGPEPLILNKIEDRCSCGCSGCGPHPKEVTG